jgi:general stress protein 26
MKARAPGEILLEKAEGDADVDRRLRHIAGRSRFAALATVSPGGPHQSLVAFAIAPDLRELVFATPKNTQKYSNLVSDPRVSVLLGGGEARAKGALGGEAISLDGKARVVRRGKRRDDLAALLLSVHPELEAFLAAPSTALVAIEVESSAHVEDFQRVSVRASR